MPSFSSPLTRIPDVIHGESLYGYIRRLAVANCCDRLGAFRTEVGLENFGTTSDDDRWRHLSNITNTPLANLEALRWRPDGSASGEGILKFLKSSVRRTFVSMRRMRFCPLCLRQDGVLRDFWALHYALACPRHETMLTDCCDVCGEVFDYRSKGAPWACPCGREMADVVAPQASHSSWRTTMMLLPSFGIQTVFPHVRLDSALKPPQAFRRCIANDLMTAIDHIGTIATTDPAKDRDWSGRQPRQRDVILGAEPSASELVARADAALQVMDRWPKGYHDLLEQLKDRREQKGMSRHRLVRTFATSLGNRAIRPPRGIDGAPIAPLAEAVESFLALPHIMYRPRERRTVYRGEGKNSRVLWPQGSLSTFLSKLGPQTYGSSWIHPELLQPVSDQLGQDLFDASEVQALVKELETQLRPLPSDLDGAISLWNVFQEKVATYAYSLQNALIDIRAGRLAAFSSTRQLRDAMVLPEDVRRQSVRNKVRQVTSSRSVMLPTRMLDLIEATWPNHARLTRRELIDDFYDADVRVETGGRTGPRSEYIQFGYLAHEFLRRCRDRFGPSSIVPDPDLF